MKIIFLSLIIYIISCSGPPKLGATKGLLTPCPESPNCVSSQSNDKEHKISPCSYNGSLEQTVEQLKLILRAMPNARIIKISKNYIRAEFTTRWMRFVDDGEFYIDSQNRLIHMRSASRIGHSDFGVNRERMEYIRKKLLSSGIISHN